MPEVWGSAYDVRCLMNAAYRLRDDKPITDLKMNPAEKLALKAVIDKVKGTQVFELLQRYGLVEGGEVNPQIM